ncbi:MAG: hypothetical protein KatS3mg130_1670 [Candidatus Sumerlaea sp.]|nr:MAG: hypothetical protein KatS3mg130_1670 [Candidatus Sumerlaea sp.]
MKRPLLALVFLGFCATGIALGQKDVCGIPHRHYAGKVYYLVGCQYVVGPECSCPADVHPRVRSSVYQSTSRPSKKRYIAE